MKKIAKLYKETPYATEIVIDCKNPAYYDEEGFINTDYIFKDEQNKFKFYERIIIKNCKVIPKDFTNNLAISFYKGSCIEINNAQIINKHPKPYIYYTFTDYNLTMPMSKALANFQVGTQTFLEYLTEFAKKNTLTANYIPHEIWELLDKYTQQTITKVQKHNQPIMEIYEHFYKLLTKIGLNHNFKVFSPNIKTFYEATAEHTFEQAIKEHASVKPLSDEEMLFLTQNAHFYGVDIPTFNWRMGTRRLITKNNKVLNTQEPEYVPGAMSSEDWGRAIYDPRNKSKDQRTSMERKANIIHSQPSNKCLRESYTRLKWLIDNLGDNALDLNYKRCPHCHNIYNEKQGCDCGKIPGITTINADNMFYGITDTYEDYDATSDYYDEIITEEIED